MSRSEPDMTYRKDYWKDRVQPKLEMVTGWARNGLSNEQIALNLGIGPTSFYKFLKEHEELEEALYLGKEDAETCVENALFKRACGYTAKEKTKERKKVLDEDNKWTGEYEIVTTKVVTKHIAPDVNAAMYWLEHRAPRRWERTPVPVTDVNAVNAAILSLAQLLKNPVSERQIGCEDND